MNVVSVVIGVVSLLVAVVGFFPLLGWLNWLALLGAVIGLVCGLLSRGTSGRNINIVVILLAVFRLSLGGGIF
ncbi:MAG: hypothetical protein M3511_06000 [Deinococcota bacterium]|jgi:hypothetical protein|nr:hypothetical protein [Deinococcota bacterium]